MDRKQCNIAIEEGAPFLLVWVYSFDCCFSVGITVFMVTCESSHQEAILLVYNQRCRIQVFPQFEHTAQPYCNHNILFISIMPDMLLHRFCKKKQKKKKRKKSILHACFGIKHSCLFLFGLGSFFHRGVGRAELTSLV